MQVRVLLIGDTSKMTLFSEDIKNWYQQVAKQELTSLVIDTLSNTGKKAKSYLANEHFKAYSVIVLDENEAISGQIIQTICGKLDNTYVFIDTNKVVNQTTPQPKNLLLFQDTESENFSHVIGSYTEEITRKLEITNGISLLAEGNYLQAYNLTINRLVIEQTTKDEPNNAAPALDFGFELNLPAGDSNLNTSFYTGDEGDEDDEHDTSIVTTSDHTIGDGDTVSDNTETEETDAGTNNDEAESVNKALQNQQIQEILDKNKAPLTHQQPIDTPPGITPETASSPERPPIENHDGKTDTENEEQSEQVAAAVTVGEQQATNEEEFTASNNPVTYDEAEIERLVQTRLTEIHEQQLKSVSMVEMTRALQLQMANGSWKEHKTIAVWSPLPRAGVTSFVVNFACYLADCKVQTAVLEGVRQNAMLKHVLLRYMDEPQNWRSIASCIRNGFGEFDGKGYIKSLGTVQWSYKNVQFVPLDDIDFHLSWTREMLEIYLNMVKQLHVTLVDLPAGAMSELTVASLSYADELWVIVDDAFQETVAWKQYIHHLRDSYGITVKLVFNKTYDFSEAARMEKDMGIDMIAKIPAIHEQTMKNYYEAHPVLYSGTVREVLHESYSQLANYLVGKEYIEMPPLTAKEKFVNVLEKLLSLKIFTLLKLSK